MNSIIGLFTELVHLITIQNLLLLAASSVSGIIIGALPGLTATMGIALLAGLTYGMSTDVALIVLLGIYVGGMYGGSMASILIGIPGTGSAAATVLDGHPLAIKGEGGTALKLATIASFLGTLFGMICLAGFTPLLQKLALNFTSAEFALLAIFGVMICGSLTAAGKAIKGWIAGFIGLAISTIGMEGIYSYPRYTFDMVGLLGGVAFVSAMIGLFGIPNVIAELSREPGASKVTGVGKTEKLGMGSMLRRYSPTILRSGIIGTFIGAIPGVGEDVAAWLSYDQAKKSSKHPEEFGKGAYEGVIAAETANNSAIGGAMIPLLSLAIPGSAPAAVLLGALWLHGIRPGPMLSFEFPTFIFKMGALLLLAAFVMRIFALMICHIAPNILKVKSYILMPIVAVLSIMGSYALNVSIFDLYVMFLFGLVGYAFDRLKFPAAPIVLGVILGPLADTNLRRALQGADGSFAPFVTRPISLIILGMIVYTMLSQMGIPRKIQEKVRRAGKKGRK